MSKTKLTKELNDSFDKWVDDTDSVSDELLKLSNKNGFNEKKVRAQFRKFLQAADAEGETLDDMVTQGIDLLNEIIEPNKSVFWPDEYEKKDNKLKLGGFKLKGNTKNEDDNEAKAEGEEAEETEGEKAEGEKAEVSSKPDTANSSPKPKGKKGKKEKAPKRQRGYDLYFNEHKVEMKEELKTDWETRFPDEDYIHNPTAVSKELGARWRGQSKRGSAAEQKKRNLNEKQRKDYNTNADKKNLANGIAPKVSKQVNESDKKPLTAYQMFNKDVYDEMAELYRKENKLSKEDKVKPTKIMKMTAKRWNEEIKPNKKKVAEYQTKADAFNKEKGREYKPKEKSAKVSTSKTNAYREFCRWFREDYRKRHKETEDGNPYEEAQKMNSDWNTKIKNTKLVEKWQDKSDEVNLERGIPVSE